MEILASLFGGMGLFFLGIRLISQHLQALAGRRMRGAVRRATSGPLATGLAGIALGALTQSSNAVTFIVTSMLSAGLLPVRRALQLVSWGNLGTAGLVLLATVDLRLAVLWLLGAVGFATFFNLDRGGRLRPLLGALFGLGLLFLGLTVLRAGAAPLRELEVVRDALALAGGNPWVPFGIACAVTLLAQSSSTVSILAIALAGAGVLDREATMMVVYGASLGSGLSVLLPAGQVSGTARQPALFQVLFKSLGTLVFLALEFLEREAGIPLVHAVLPALATDVATQVGLLFLGFQLLTAVLLAPLEAPLRWLLARLSPATTTEALARPQYLYDHALDDAATALDLVEREQARLLARLPALLDPVRVEAGAASVPAAGLAEASAAVERAVATFLAELLGRGCPPDLLERAVLLEARTDLIGGLRETVSELAATIGATQQARAGDAVGGLLVRLAESLHLLLTQLDELAQAGSAEDAATLRELTSDRGEMMNGLRRRIARADPEIAYPVQELLFRATSQFERAVWLLRRLVLSMAPAAPELVRV